MCTDTWSDAMEAWFEAVGIMYDRNLHIPSKYYYEPAPALNIQSSPDSYWHDSFNLLSNEDLIDVAEFLYRYCSFLQYKGVDY